MQPGRAIKNPTGFLDSLRSLGMTWLLLLVIGHWSLVIPANAQEIRRAEPVNTPPPDAPVRRAEPVETPAPTPPPRRTKPLEPEIEPFEFDTQNPAGTPSQRTEPAPTPISTPAPTPPVEPGTSYPYSAEAPAPAPGADQAQLAFANSLYSRKIYDLAAPEYEKYLRDFDTGPERATAQFRLAECQRALNQTESAKRGYDLVVSLFSTTDYAGPAAYRLGEIYFQEKEYASALPLFRKAAVKVTDPLVVLASRFYASRCLESLSLNAEARGNYEIIVKTPGKNPFREAARLSLAKLYTDVRRKDDAIEQYAALAKETEKPELRAEALVKGGLLKIETGKTTEAAEDLNAALAMPEIGGWKEIARLGLLHTLYDGGKYQEMVDSYAKLASEISPENKPELLILVANARRQLGQHKEARATYEEIVKNYPKSLFADEAAYERLVSLYNTDDPNLITEADAYLTGVEDPARRDQITLMKAEALYKRGDFSAAAPVYAVLEKSRLAPALRAEAVFKLGWCFMQTRETARAAEAFTTFIDENPRHKLLPTALAQRGVARQQLKKYPEALADFNAIITRHPKSKERQFALQQKALILGQQQDNAGMSAAFKQLLQEYPKSPAAAQANYWIGWTAYEAKDYRGAVEPLASARELDKEQFFERATLRLLLCHYYMEERGPLAKEVDLYTGEGGKGEVPAEVLRWLGQSFMQDERFDAAAKYFAILVKRGNGDTKQEDDLNLAKCQVQIGKFAEAAETLQSYLPNTSEPYPKAAGLIVLGRAQLGQNKTADAQKSAEEACSLQPEGRLNAEGRVLLGDIAAGKGNLEEAAKIFVSVSLVFDDPAITPQALEKAYNAYKKAGNEDEAAKVLNKLQSRYPEYKLTTASTASGS